jgi:ribose 5-phosphate isomerase B
MKIAVGSDHAGFDLKETLKHHIESKGIDIKDFGTGDTESADYPDFAFDVATAVARGEYDYGVLVCSTGIGMSVAANKVRGVRAAIGYNPDAAAQSRAHIDANVLVFGQRYADPEEALMILDRWLETPFEGGRHERRVGKIKDFEQKGECREADLG